jgi:tRNA1(Val) A37 N6-methylase TrmN6
MKKVPVLLPFQKTIYQPAKGHSITTDTEDLVNQVLAEHPEDDLSVLDLGTGIGILVIMMKHYRPNWRCTGIDIQNELIELAGENAADLGVDIDLINGDFRNHSFCRKFDLIVSNPPFQKMGSGRIPAERCRAIARHEITCSIDSLLTVISANLKGSGFAYVIYPDSRSAEIEKKTKNIDLRIENKIIIAKSKIVRSIFKFVKNGLDREYAKY